MKTIYARLSTVLVLTTGALAACATPLEEEGSSADAVTTPPSNAKYFQTWKGPQPGTTGNDLDAALVLDAWRKVESTFYDARNAPNRIGDRDACLQGNDVPWWSDLVQHFYCTIPGYDPEPFRDCFTNGVREEQGPAAPPPGANPAQYTRRRLAYPEAYDYCLFQYTSSDPNPVYDTSIIERSKDANRRAGVFKWIDDNIGDAFKHVMFTGYDATIYDFAKQQAVVNAFYGVQDPNDPSECSAKRPIRAGDPSNGAHCRLDTPRGTQSQSAPQAIGFMTRFVKTLPYTPTSVTAGRAPGGGALDGSWQLASGSGTVVEIVTEGSVLQGRLRAGSANDASQQCELTFHGAATGGQAVDLRVATAAGVSGGRLTVTAAGATLQLPGAPTACQNAFLRDSTDPNGITIAIARSGPATSGVVGFRTVSAARSPRYTDSRTSTPAGYIVKGQTVAVRRRENSRTLAIYTAWNGNADERWYDDATFFSVP